MKKLITEGLGTFFLTLVFLMTYQTPMAPLAVGLVLVSLIFTGGYLSEGYFNPAIALAMRLRGKLGVSEFFSFCMVQIIGALAGASVATALLRCTKNYEIILHKNELFCSLIAEFLGVFALVWVTLHVTRGKEKMQALAPVAIGFAMIALTFAFKTVSGGVLNPALAMGMVVSGVLAWADVWLYFLSAGLGAAAAASVFQVFFGWEG